MLSSNVTTTSVPFMKSELASSGSRNLCNHRERKVTPLQRWAGVESGGECPSFWIFGVYQQYCGRTPLSMSVCYRRAFTILAKRSGLPRMLLREMNGLCLRK